MAATQSQSNQAVRSFAYPVYFISEDYHIMEENKSQTSSIQCLPNRLLDEQAKCFQDRRKKQVKKAEDRKTSGSPRK